MVYANLMPILIGGVSMVLLNLRHPIVENTVIK